MRRGLLALLVLLSLTSARAQGDTDLRDFADKKVPASVCCGIVSFRATLITINEILGMPDYGMKIESDSISPLRMRFRFNYNEKDVDSVAIYFDSIEGESWYSAGMNTMELRFKNKAFKDVYLKKLGAATVPGKRWDFWLNKKECRGIQIYSEEKNKIRLQIITNCGAG